MSPFIYGGYPSYFYHERASILDLWTHVIRYLIFPILVYKVNHACMAMHDAIELLNDSQITRNTKQKVGLGMGEGKETATDREYNLHMISLVPRLPPFFVLRFSLSIIHAWERSSFRKWTRIRFQKLAIYKIQQTKHHAETSKY